MAIRGDVYIIEYLAAYEALREAGDQAMEASQDSSLQEDERARAGALSIDLGTQLLLLKVAHETLMNEFATVSPPSEADVEKAISLAQQLAQLVSDRLAAEANLEAVIGVISALGQLPIKPATPATPATSKKVVAASTTMWLRKVKAAATKP